LSASCTLPPDDQSVREMRRFAVLVLSLWGVDEELADRTVMVVSELITNALVAQRRCWAGWMPPIGTGLRADEAGQRVRVEIRDWARGIPVPRDAGPDAEEGRGLALVVALSDRWGWVPGAVGGKCVWADLSSRAEQPDADLLLAGAVLASL
jgi:anti-sigma regulatory factor (Ser/Thr protein kinase)